MKYIVKLISGNSFSAHLEAETEDELTLLSLNNHQNAITGFYKLAVKATLGKDVRVASLTPNEDFPYSATIEVFS